MRRVPGSLYLLVAVFAFRAVPVQAAPQRATPTPAATLDRTVLPIPEPTYPPVTELDARKVTPPPVFDVKAPAGAPNVLIILIDDMGFGMPSTFGGPIHMPTVDQLASEGLRYNQFHTTALCSPTRTALLSGRNHHTNNMGSITETATAFPGNTGKRPDSVAPLAEMLRLNGYSTSFFGKNHETATWEISISGPTSRWPNRSGFDEFYGFMGGETNQWAPLVYHNQTPVEVPKDPKYHFMTDMTDKAVAWVQAQKSLTPDRPFFMYFAPGATHAPHHVPKESIAKYKGKFDKGWDTMREEVLARQIQLGVVPAGTKLAPKPEAIKDWDKLSAEEKKLFTRQMEVYAGFAEFTDTEIGRLVAALKEVGQYENTLVFYILGDNGSSAEGGMNGMFSEMTYFNGVQETVADIMKHYDELGGPMSYPHMAAGWAVAGDTPFTWTKQVASNFGGTRNGMVVHWPKGIQAKGEVRSQFHHVIDVAPTILEAAGLPEPRSVQRDRPRSPSRESAWPTPSPTRRRRAGTRSSTSRSSATGASTPTAGSPARSTGPPGSRSRARRSPRTGGALRHAHRLQPRERPRGDEPGQAEGAPGFLHDRGAEVQRAPHRRPALRAARREARGAARPMGDRMSLTLYSGMTGMSENAFINVKNRSVTITADLDVPKGGANGAILAQGGRFGGWSLYVKGGRPFYTYNFLGLERTTISGKQAVPPGKAKVTMEFAYDGGGAGKGGVVTLLVNGKKVGAGRLTRTQPGIFSVDDAADVGMDEGTPVVEDYQPRSTKFTGTIRKVIVDVKAIGAADTADVKKADVETKKKIEEAK